MKSRGTPAVVVRLRSVKNGLPSAAPGVGLSMVPMHGVVAEHLRWCKLRNLRLTTIEQRRRHLDRLAQAVGTEELHRVHESELVAWYAGRVDVIEPEGRATELSHVRQFYRWCQLEGIRLDDPTLRLVRPRLGRRLPRPVPEDELDKAIVNATDRVRPWLVLAGYAGLRAMEIANLRGEDILARHTPPVLVVRHGKGDRDRVVPLSELVAHVVTAHDHGRLFLTLDGRPMTAANLSSSANRYLRSVGLEVTLHQFRHRFATRAYEVSGDLRVVQELMGHASPRTTAAYAAYSERTAVATVLAIAGEAA